MESKRETQLFTPGRYEVRADESGTPVSIYVDDTLKGLLGLEANTFPASELSRFAVYPDDTAFVQAKRAEAFSVASEMVPLDMEYRVMTPQGYRLVHDSACCIQRADGRLVQFKGMLFDIQNAADHVHDTRAEEFRRQELLNHTIKAKEVFLVDYVHDKAKTIRCPEKYSSFLPDEGVYSEMLQNFVQVFVAEGDRDRFLRHLMPEAIHGRLGENEEYTVPYRDIYGGYQMFFEVTVTRYSETEVLVSFLEKDKEITRELMFRRIEEDYFSIYCIDLDAALVQVVKAPESYSLFKVGQTVTCSEFCKSYAACVTDDTAGFWTTFSDPEDVRRRLMKEDKVSRVFHAVNPANQMNRWVSCTELVLARHTSGVPSMIALACNYLDENATRLQEAQVKLREDAEMINSLASGYYALYYYNFATRAFSVFSVHRDRYPELKPILSRDITPESMLASFGSSDLVHPEDKYLFNSLTHDYLWEQISRKKKFSLRFRRRFEDAYRWAEMDLVKQDAADEAPTGVVIGFADCDAEVRSREISDRCFDVLTRNMQPGEAMNIILSNTGRYYNAQRVMLFEFSTDGRQVNTNFEWCAEGLAPITKGLKALPIESVSGWLNALKADGAFFMNVGDGPEAFHSSAAMAFMNKAGIESFVSAPLLNGDTITGFIVVLNPKQEPRNTEVLRGVATALYSEILKHREHDEEHITLSKISDTMVAILYADLEKDYIHAWKVAPRYWGRFTSFNRFTDMADAYIQSCIPERQWKKAYTVSKPDFIRDLFRDKERFSFDVTDTSTGEDRDLAFDFLKVDAEGTQFVICCKDVTDSIAAEHKQQAELRAALDAADAANRSKTSFLFNMSHDIRTPMNAITGFTSMAIRHIDDREKALDCLNKIQQSGGMLLSLINSVLEVSRIESGKIVPEELPSDILSGFKVIEAPMRELADAKDIDLSFEYRNIRHRNVICDVGICVRILVNLISNAVKYTREGGWARFVCEEVCAENGTGTYRFTVTDNGIGMSDEFQKHVFEQFSRENNTTYSGIQGTGLGLSVCKSFAEMLHGTIACESRQGVGSTFTVTLPFRLQDQETAVTPMEPEAVAENADFTGTRVLLVEDNELNREIAVDILEESGFEVDEAEDGSVAVEKLRAGGAGAYDLILMDVQMPVMNGYETTRAIRAMYPDEHIPIIALSANAFAEDRKRSMEVGMDDHVAKPINTEELFTAMGKYL